jgi:plasmid stabilization system protein ParE
LLKLVWERPALDDLAEAAAWSPRQAQAVVREMERMCARGWSLGHPTEDGLRYWPVPPLAVFYELVGYELHVVGVRDARRFRCPPP